MAIEFQEVDPEAEAQERQLMDQTHETMRNLLQDRAAAEPSRGTNRRRTERSSRKAKPIDPEDAAMTVEEYVVAMARGNLDEAEALAAHLVGNAPVVKPIISKAMEGGLSHSSLREIPPAVQKGFLNKLLEYLE